MTTAFVLWFISPMMVSCRLVVSNSINHTNYSPGLEVRLADYQHLKLHPPNKRNMFWGELFFKDFHSDISKDFLWRMNWSNSVNNWTRTMFFTPKLVRISRHWLVIKQTWDNCNFKYKNIKIRFYIDIAFLGSALPLYIAILCVCVSTD